MLDLLKFFATYHKLFNIKISQGKVIEEKNGKFYLYSLTFSCWSQSQSIVIMSSNNLEKTESRRDRVWCSQWFIGLIR